ncbi:MAG TPA: VOC family protein [Candidatus Dormibacteraeota bacterium]
MTTPNMGEPGWIDLESADVDAAHTFYTGVFGWTVDVVPDGGGYGMFLLDGKQVAGVSPRTDGEGPSAWTMYVLTEDAAASAAKATEAGGTVIAPTVEVTGAGTMGIVADPSGAVIGLWQPNEHKGFEVMRVPGAFCWAELNAKDLPSDKLFYWNAFGWDPKESAVPGTNYTEFKLDGTSVAGGLPMDPDLPEGTPSNWVVYFAVADTDATVAKLTELGGGVHHPPSDIPGVGRFAIVHDPQGAVFAVLQNTQTATS